MDATTNSIETTFQSALAHFQAGRLVEAVASYLNAVSIQTDY